MSSAQKPLPTKPTYADIEALPEHLRGEIIAGELVVQPRPAMPHAVVATGLGSMLNVGFSVGIGGPGGWWIVFEPELSLGVDPNYDPVVPDIAGWRIETLPEIAATAKVRTVPDWVCEVLSPRTAGSDRLLKLPFYGRAGVKHCWLVDPIEHSVEVFRNTEAGWLLVTTHQGDEPLCAEPFEAMTLPMDKIWSLKADPGST